MHSVQAERRLAMAGVHPVGAFTRSGKASASNN